MVRTVEGSPMGRSKSQAIIPVICTVSYADIPRRNILPKRASSKCRKRIEGKEAD